MKVCLICKAHKPVDAFSGGGSYCKICQNKFNKQYRNGPARQRVLDGQKTRWKNTSPEKKLDAHLKSRYGITLNEYNEKLEAQQKMCAICFQPPQRLRLSVDHCHASGKVRGLLCERCNSMLGRVKDDPKILENAAEYVRTWTAK